MSEFVPSVTKCNTCKALFETTEQVRDHYRTDWHILNSRRRGNNLPPITFLEFKKTQKSSSNKPSVPSTPRVHVLPSATIQNIVNVDLETAGIKHVVKEKESDEVVDANMEVIEVHHLTYSKTSCFWKYAMEPEEAFRPVPMS